MTVFADVSMWQAFIPAEVTAVVVKATQGRKILDPQYGDHLETARARGFRHVGHYHFLTSDPAEMQWSFFRQALESLGGGLRVGEFIALDWESNAITGGPAPARAVAREWLDLAGTYAPGRVCWYSYRSLAIAARQSGDFPEPLWLADPNPDGLAWAERLDAFLLQSGQEYHDGLNIDVNDVIDRDVLELLCGYGEVEMKQEDFSAMLARALGGTAKVGLDGVVYVTARDGKDYPVGSMIVYMHQEAQDAHVATASIGTVASSSSAAAVADEFARRLTT